MGRGFRSCCWEKLRGFFILLCFPTSLNAGLPASSALHSFSEAFHSSSALFPLRPLSLSFSFSLFPFSFLSILQCSARFFRQGHLETSVNMVTKLFRQTDRSSDWRRAPTPPQASFPFSYHSPPLLLSLFFSLCRHRSTHD